MYLYGECTVCQSWYSVPWIHWEQDRGMHLLTLWSLHGSQTELQFDKCYKVTKSLWKRVLT